MDLIVQMLPECVRYFSTHMDFIGQHRAERIMQVILVISGVVGFFVGFFFERVSYMIFTILGGAGLAALIIMPPWPCFRRNAMQWRPKLTPEDIAKEAEVANAKNKKTK